MLYLRVIISYAKKKILEKWIESGIMITNFSKIINDLEHMLQNISLSITIFYN